jgi:hypothetical protein
MARFISAQMDARPQGPHCENTKIWPLCVSAAGLGLKLYDTLLDTSLNEPFLRWIEFAKQHYTGRTRRGDLDWFTLYYDPVEKKAATGPGPVTAHSAITVLLYLHPQDPDFTTELYEMAMTKLGWNNPRIPVIQLAADPQMVASALWMAREVGDSTTEDRIRQVTETTFEPRWFGEDESRFAFWPGLDTPWPRGQINATMMMTECASPGAWSRVYNAPNTTMYTEPTVRDLDYPALGIRWAQNDMPRRVLEVDTFVATPSKRGAVTTFSVDHLPPDASVSVTVDGNDFGGWRATGPTSGELTFDIASHQIRIAF